MSAVVTSSLLVACGGGGDSESDLQVSYACVPDGGVAPSAFTDYKVTLNVGGLNGHRPHFTLVAGQLPAGLTLNSDTGIASGTITAGAGSYASTVRLTVDGYKGSLDATCNVQVLNYNLIYIGDTVRPLAPISVRPVPLRTTQPYTATYVPGTVLPAGLVLDPATGAITGSLAQAGTTMIPVTQTIVFKGQTFTYTGTAYVSVSNAVL